MTDHPLTDKICLEITNRPYMIDTRKDDMRAGADWQLKQVINWCSKYVHTKSVDALREAMRPTQEDN